MAGFDGMDPAFATALGNLMRASGGAIGIKSGYRTPERQAQLFAQAVQKYGSPEKARRYVAPPGKSNHGRGVAADLDFKTPEAKALAHKLAPQFGLIFPMDYEPWHIEPVHARDSADPAAYKLPTNGALHPQDPKFTSTRPDVLLAQLSDAIISPTRAGKAQIIAEGGFVGDGTQQVAQSKDALTSGGFGGGTGGGGDTTDRFLSAVKRHESGGNYKAQNPHASASGAYQFIDQTWNHYGGYAHAKDAPPAVQDAKAREYLAGLQSLSEDPRVWSVGWYGGGGPARQAAAGKLNWSQQPNKGLSYQSFADYIVQNMGT